MIVFTAAIAMTLVGAFASLLRGERYVHDDEPDAVDRPHRREGGAVMTEHDEVGRLYLVLGRLNRALRREARRARRSATARCPPCPR